VIDLAISSKVKILLKPEQTILTGGSTRAREMLRSNFKKRLSHITSGVGF
jgi:hypothetical protein